MEKEYFPRLLEIHKNIKEVIGEEEAKIGKEELEKILIKSEEMLAKELAHNIQKKF